MSPELVAEELYKDSILTLEMKETILMQLTRFAKNKKMLDTVPKRGQRAFHSFCLALEKAGQSHLSIGLREEHINGAKESTRNQDTATNLSSWKRPSKNYTQLCMIDLGDDIYVTANRYDQDNTVQIHLRQYTQEGKNKPYPTKKGITMSTTEWLTLESFLDGMTEALKNHSERQVEETWFLGSNIFVKASKDYPLLDLRHYWKPDPNEDFVPTRKGIKLNRRRLDQLRNAALIIRDFIPSLGQDIIEYPILPTELDMKSLEGLLDYSNC